MQGLEGVKVVELGQLVSAAYAGKIMADLGADVVKVEEPGGDVARQRGPFPGGVADLEKSGLFLALNTNKRGITLDLARGRTGWPNSSPGPILWSTITRPPRWPSGALTTTPFGSSTPGWSCVRSRLLV